MPRSLWTLSSPLQDLEQFLQGGDFFLRGVDDRAPFLQRRLRPVLQIEPHAAVSVHVDDNRVHRLDVEPHQTPAAADARSASSTPSTIVAVGLPSAAPPYAYASLTLASLISFSAGASAPGAFGPPLTITLRWVPL